MVSAVPNIVLRLFSGATPFPQFAMCVEEIDELTMLHIIPQEVIKKCSSLQYVDMDITSIISQSGTDVLAIIDKPVSVFLKVTGSENHNEVSGITNQYYSFSIQAPSAVNAFSNMMVNPRAKIAMIQLSWSLGAVCSFMQTLM